MGAPFSASSSGAGYLRSLQACLYTRGTMLTRIPPMNTAPASPPDERGLRIAVAAHPDVAEAHVALASFLCEAGRVGEALAHLDREIERQPSKLWPRSIKAGIFSGEHRTAEALDVHRTLVAMAPDVPLLWANFGSDLAAVGDVTEAATAFRKTIDRAPDFGAAWLGLANLPDQRLGDADLAAMERGLTLARDPYQKIQILFALGRAFGALGAFDRSFEHYTEAHVLREAVAPHDSAGLAAFVEAHERLGASFFAADPDIPMHETGAIFIVGMPRSGSTLVEQILASHPEVEAMGELFALPDIAASIGAFDAPDAFSKRLQTLSRTEATQLGERYLASVERRRRTDRPCFTDKMPANWRFTALIHRILPGARIIDARREPLACCFSAYTTYFNRRTDFPNTLPDLGGYYRQYVRMMEITSNLPSEKLYRLDHAQLVSNTEQEIRSLLRFLRLPFSASCLAPEENPRAIYTPSAQQVRSPIRPMKNRWRAYLPWLGPLKGALDAAN